MKLDIALFDLIAKQAADSPRLRMNYDLRDSDSEDTQRMLNVLLPGTIVEPHRHTNSSEMIVCIQGKVLVSFYDDECKTVETVEIVAGGECPGIVVEIDRWHSVKPIDGQATIITVMTGKYNPAECKYSDSSI